MDDPAYQERNDAPRTWPPCSRTSRPTQGSVLQPGDLPSMHRAIRSPLKAAGKTRPRGLIMTNSLMTAGYVVALEQAALVGPSAQPEIDGPA